MNLLTSIIERLNQRATVGNIFDQIYGLCELYDGGSERAWVHYIGNGQAIPVTNFDAKQGTLFWAKRGKTTVSKTESLRVAGCKTMYETRFPLTAYAVVRKSHLPCDSSEAQDWVASRVYKLVSGSDPKFKVALGVVNYEVLPNGYTNDIKQLPPQFEWACVSIEMDAVVTTFNEDGCYDTCATGDIPLPDFEPCTPCLTEVAVDGITITGNGTPDDPLVAVGGGGGSQNLQQVTDVGNTTTNDIDLIGNAGIVFDNGARFRKGTTDAGLGGSKGTAQICSIDYELKWEAGRLYYMQQDGFTIREVTHNFNVTPSVTDDASKGFTVGSRWVLDDGTVYLCSDNTIGAAVWAVISGTGVIAVTGTSPIASSGGATPDISISQASGISDGYLSSTDWLTFDGKFPYPTGTNLEYVRGDGALSTFPTIPTTIVESVTATSPVASSGGANPDISIAQASASSDGYLSSTDWSTFDGKFDAPTGTSLEYLDGTGTPQTFPTIPAAQIQSDWNQANTSALDYIKNKPTIPSVSGFVPYTGATADVDLGTYNITADHITLNTNPSGAGFVTGSTEWNNTIGSSQTLLKGGNVILKNGVDLVARIVNKVTPNTTLTKAAYQAVRVSGATGGRLSISLAQANTDNNSADTIGLVTETIATNQEGFIITVGQLLDINTTGSLQGETWADGDVLYLSPTTAGKLTNIKPTGATGHIVVMGYVEYAHPTQGSIYVKVMNGWELDELHNVYINSPANNEALIYESSTQLWKNKTLAAALGYTPVTDAITISTSSPLSGGGDLTANRTISIADAAADGSTKGAAAFTASDFNSAAGVISIDYTNGQAASGSTKGFLTSADWTTFNGKQNAITPAALTKVDDTNVTLTLGGSPSTSLLAATSLTLGWTGTLADARIASAATWNAKQAALVSGTNIKTINNTSILGSGNYATPFELVVAASDETTALTTGTAKITFRMPRAVTLTAVRASLTIAQTSGSLLTINIKESGTTILSTKITINNGQRTSTTATTPPMISDANLADDAEMTIDIDQIGDGTATGLKVMLIGTYA